MPSAWYIACASIAVLAILQSAALLLQTWEHRRYVRSCLRSQGRYRPEGRAAVVAPCKGVDVGLADNLRALLEQDYDDYEITFVVESDDDPACEVIEQVTAAYPHIATRLVVAGRASNSGQKVHNLRVATADLGEDVDYVAFVDSDARPRPEWLRMLISRLSQEPLGAATGYRWFIPVRPTLAASVLSSVNCGLMMLSGRRSYYLVWGGSWALRREVFEQIGLRDAWHGTLSDDLMAARVLRRARLKTRFEPLAVVPSPLDTSPRRMFEFLRRQYVVTRFYVPHWWLFGLAVMAVPNLAWAGLAAMLVAGLAGGPTVAVPLGLGAALWAVGAVRGAVRQSLVAAYFPQHLRATRAARWFDILAGPVAGLVHWLGMWAAACGRRIRWRGVCYRLFPGGRIEIEQRAADPEAAAPAESSPEPCRHAA
jgi:cellulose synthase/poly-beta-1,6-N-acetylglucosamine synthase-like glycosyltransferase